MIEIDTLFQTKTAKKNIPFGTARHGTALQFMSLAAYASETNNNIPTNTKWLSYELDQGIRWSF